MASTGEVWRLGHRPALDGVRGVAVLLVIANHSGAPGVLGLGAAGVTAFFVLSGFLITTLLIEERDRTGGVKLVHFFQRRARRLMPALVACVGVVALVALPLGSAFLTSGEVWSALTYTMDFRAASSASLHGLLGHTWSLGIEEQFYLLWPFALVALRTRRALAVALACGILLTVAWRVVLVLDGASIPRIAYAPDARADALLIGCLAAALMAGRVVPIAPRGVALAGFAGLVLTAAQWMNAGAVLLASLCAAAVIWSGATRPAVGVLTNRALRLIGRRSYGMYLWHYPIMLLTVSAMPGAAWWQQCLVSLPLSTLATAASWRLVERPFLKPASGHARGAAQELERSLELSARA